MISNINSIRTSKKNTRRSIHTDRLLYHAQEHERNDRQEVVSYHIMMTNAARLQAEEDKTTHSICAASHHDDDLSELVEYEDLHKVVDDIINNPTRPRETRERRDATMMNNNKSHIN